MNNPCTSCKHYQPSYRCGKTGLLTSCSRAYKTDEDDCFDDRMTAVEVNQKQMREHFHKLRSMTYQERQAYLYADISPPDGIDPFPRRCKAVKIFEDVANESFNKGTAGIMLTELGLINIRAEDIRKGVTDFIDENEK